MTEVKSVPFNDIVGKTIERVEGLEKESENVRFFCTDGAVYQMHHYQRCCERVSLDDIDGGENLLRATVVEAEEVCNNGDEDEDSYESHTWTFYKFRTSKGYTTLKWFGSSNGHYSESVDFERIVENE